MLLWQNIGGKASRAPLAKAWECEKGVDEKSGREGKRDVGKKTEKNGKKGKAAVARAGKLWYNLFCNSAFVFGGGSLFRSLSSHGRALS